MCEGLVIKIRSDYAYLVLLLPTYAFPCLGIWDGCDYWCRVDLTVECGVE